MDDLRGAMSRMQISHYIEAPRSVVYRALLDPAAIAVWKVPTDMTCRVHAFDAREGGTFRVSLTYQDATQRGKSAEHTDTYHGHFARLVTDECVVEVGEFETNDPAMRGQMTITTTLVDKDGGTGITMHYEGLPPGVSIADNEIGTRMALQRLAALVEEKRP